MAESSTDTKNVEVKRRKIRKTDWQQVETFIKKELAKRQSNDFRKSHERIWTEVDRQIRMEPVQKMTPAGKPTPPGWQSAFELGELSKASEIITADVLRLIFPGNRSWFETHIKPPMTVDPQTGKATTAVDPKQQQMADAALRSLMSQQHEDFGLRARVELSIKEALHHGGLVATVEWASQNKVYDGKGLESLEAPVWVPHSMWNCYPDSSPSVVPSSIFYPGSMMIVSYMNRQKVLELKGDGYLNIDPKKIPKKNQNKDVKEEDCEIVTYYGDLVIERDDGDIFLPNSKCMTANGVVIYYNTNPLPFPEVIYVGYERQDVRDPYFTSPIVKNSPMQKVASILANKFIDAVDLHTTPPIVYDGNDPYMVQNGGVAMFPGAQTASKGSNKFQQVVVGDPNAALQGLQLALTKLEEGTAVNAIRSGTDSADRKTATEVSKTAQGAEVRTVDFVGKLEPGALKPFLYMQHEMNLKKLVRYSFYCSEKSLPDFLSMTKKDLPQVVHFDIVGSKGVLGEERRAQQMSSVTAFLLSNPLTAPIVNIETVAIDMYEDAGVKGAELYIKTGQPQIPPQVKAQLAQAQQIIQELQQKLKDAESNMQAKMAELQVKHQANLANAKIDKEKSDREFALKLSDAQKQYQLDVQEANRQFALQLTQTKAEMQLEREKTQEQLRIERLKVQQDNATRQRKVKFSDGEEATIEG